MTCKFCNDTGCTACRITTQDDALRAEIAKLRVDLNRAETHAETMDAGLALLLASIPMGEIVTAGASFPDLANSLRRAYAARDGYHHTMGEARADLAAAFSELESMREECNRRGEVIDRLTAQLANAQEAPLAPEGLEPANLPPESERPIGLRALALFEMEWREPRGNESAGLPPSWYFPKDKDGMTLSAIARQWYEAPKQPLTHAAAVHLIDGDHYADDLGIE